jgi:methionyl-tRNA formyltransferase
MQKPFAIPDDADVEYVYDGLMHLGADICLETLERIIAADGHPESIPQEEMISVGSELYAAPKIFKETCEINWDQPAKKVYDFIRGLSPYPGAWCTLLSPEGKETVLKIYKTRKTHVATNQNPGTIRVEQKALQVAAGDEWLEITELQIAGKKRMTARDFLNGIKIENFFVR